MFESKSGVFLVAGIGFFLLAFLGSGVVPWIMFAHLKEQTAEELVNRNVLQQFRDLADRYPEAFRKHYPEGPTEANCARALRLGRRVYIAEACWHCHSQFVRPVSNEERRWGPVAQAGEYQNELQRPVLFGTRRVGPDLSREGGRRSNDWHVVHFFRPRMVAPESVMPTYPWFFEDNKPDGPGTPNERGFSIITYMQWLGSWLDSYPSYRTTRDRDAHDFGGPR